MKVPIVAAKTVSKNQRVRPKAEQRKHYCAEGHEQERVKLVPVVGRARLYWRCLCGYE